MRWGPVRLALDAPSLVDLAAVVRAGERTPTDLIEAALARLDAVESRLAAFTLVAAERARHEARQLTDDARAGRWRGPLHGVPVVVKDLFDVAGEVTGAGSRTPPSERAAVRDADAVALLRAAGAIVIGRTRTHEYAWGLTTQHPVLGGTRNPHDDSRVPGGSSGGSAAAVAAGVVPLGLGTDTAGSIRLPAAWCGVVGHKPSRDLVSLRGAVPLAPSFDHAGALVRTVPDARLALSVLTGSPVPASSWARELRGLRIGIPTDSTCPAPDAEVARVCHSAVRHAVDDGAVVCEVATPGWPALRDVFFALQASEALSYHRGLGHWPDRAELYGDDVRGRLRRAETFTAEQIATARQQMVLLGHQVDALFEEIDVIVQPVAGSGPSRIDNPDVVRVNGEVDDLRTQVLPHTLLASIFGLPACSVPAGRDPDGLPIGIQVIGAAGQDAAVLDVAERIAQLARS